VERQITKKDVYCANHPTTVKVAFFSAKLPTVFAEFKVSIVHSCHCVKVVQITARSKASRKETSGQRTFLSLTFDNRNSSSL
jgi:hypothetical protein